MMQTADEIDLLSMSKDITSCRTREDVREILTHRLANYIKGCEVMVCLNNEDGLTHTAYISVNSEETLSHPDFSRGASMKYFIDDGVFNAIGESEQPVVFDMDELVSRENKPFYIDFWVGMGVKELIGCPLRSNNECFGAMTLYPREKGLFSKAALAHLQAVCNIIGIALFNMLAFDKIRKHLEEIDSYKLRLEQENQLLQEQISTAYQFNEVIGADNGLREILAMVSDVASMDSTVLILGETGTGKEVIARAIHHASPRRDKLMVKVNCAALPANLIESELFGHERGSFTGAMERRIGKFELASGGTLFLDEIGEMALGLQAKLLRAIQEKEIERIGGEALIKTNVRLIAATNRDLRKGVEEGRFRGDLFYRLNVFPLVLPPLRDRKEDIPALVAHFVDRVARNAGKRILRVSPSAIRDLTLYDWPGNVRELEHVIERSVLMSRDGILKDVYLPRRDRRIPVAGERPMKGLKEFEREHIMEALRKSKGKVGGPGGAAEVLGMPATTLHSKIKKLGIRKEYE